MLRRSAPARAKVAAQRWPEVARAQTQPSPLAAFTSVSSRLTAKTNLNPVFAQKALSALKRWEVAACGVAPRPSSRVFWPVARGAQLTSFLAVASCGLLPRTTRPGPRVWTAFWSVASPHPREASAASPLAIGATFVQCEADQGQNSRGSRSGGIATDQKAAGTRGPGGVVRGSKPQLATAKELVRWAVRDYVKRTSPRTRQQSLLRARTYR